MDTQVASRTVRALSNIRGSASSARVLNLVSAAANHGREEQYRLNPFFRNPILNKSIILKHRLRADELTLFYPRRYVATKIILPIDRDDLRYGGRYLFVGQRHYDSLMRDCFGHDVGDGSADRVILTALDELPSLDPFILREHLARRNIKPAPCYFDVSEADIERMFDFVRSDISPLVAMCFGEASEFSAHTKRLVSKILSNDLDHDLEPLRETLKLDKEQYSEGVFCWKGFLYYKWLVSEMFPVAIAVSREISAIRATGRLDAEEQGRIKDGKERLGLDILRVCNDIRHSLYVYDRAFTALTTAGDPTAFRDFLLSSPEMFFDLGANFAAIQHIVSFWRYRVPEGSPAVMDAGELFDMLLDFESGVPRDNADWRSPASPRVAAAVPEPHIPVAVRTEPIVL